MTEESTWQKHKPSLGAVAADLFILGIMWHVLDVRMEKLEGMSVTPEADRRLSVLEQTQVDQDKILAMHLDEINRRLMLLDKKIDEVEAQVRIHSLETRKMK